MAITWGQPVQNWARFLKHRLSDKFRAKIQIYAETDQYILKTANSSEEFQWVLKLRHQVFMEELQQKRNFFRIDMDQFDEDCDHLLILEKTPSQRPKVVGCYRLLSSLFVDRFYSETEFQIDSFLAIPGNKLELGRACILAQHRNGVVIQLLWRGIAEVMKQTDSRYLMGCSSVQTLNPSTLRSVILSLKQENAIRDGFKIRPLSQYHPDHYGMDLYSHEVTAYSGTLELPPLLQSYLKAGAHVSPVPALDHAFGCADFFTVLDRENLHPLFKRRYFGRDVRN